MIYFIVDTNKYEGDVTFINGEDIKILTPSEGISLFISFIGENDIIGYDIETTGLDAYKEKVVLWGFGNDKDQYIFHHTINLLEIFKLLMDKVLLGHNIKFDVKFTYVIYSIWLRKLYDTMIAEQRIYQKSGWEMNLSALSARYLNEPMFKEVREEFIGVNPITFQLYNRHIRYAAKDIVNLFPIKEKQEILINKYKLNFLIYDIEFPLISIVAKAELTGFELDVVNWKKLYKKNVAKRFELECLLDEEVRKLRSTKPYEIRKRLIGGKFDKLRIEDKSGIFNYDDKTTNVIGLFGETMSIKTLTGKKKDVKRSPTNINYNSSDQIIDIFARLEEPMFTEHDTVSIPKLNKKERSVGYQANSDAFEAYLKMKPNCNTKQFIEHLIEYGTVINRISTFGLAFINKINPITGHIHTVYRQASAATGRFQSGGGHKEPDKPNFQNIPAEKEYRNCFLAGLGYSLITSDFSGAELMIMVSLSKDKNLLKLASKDMHSYMNQAIWRNIYKYRYQQLAKASTSVTGIPEEFEKKMAEYADLAKNIVISQTENKHLRNKNLTFGSIYGMYAAKAGKTMNVTKEEGSIAIKTIEGIIPKIFVVVKAASKFVKNNGYIIINRRTNSRAWFPNCIKALRGQLDEDENFKILQKEQSEARNIKIQGTQADFMKEAKVVLQQYIDYYNLDVTILHWVHDEIVTKVPKHLDGVSDEWKEWIKKNPRGLAIIFKGELRTGLSFTQIKELIMTTVADRYLRDVNIKVDYHVLDYWTK